MRNDAVYMRDRCNGVRYREGVGEANCELPYAPFTTALMNGVRAAPICSRGTLAGVWSGKSISLRIK